MNLTDILVPDACIIEMGARTKKEALRELAVALSQSAGGLEANDLLDQLLEREKLGTTAIGDSIAIPHARIESLDRVFAGFGRSRHGIDFDSIDGKPTQLFFLLVAPGKEGSVHLLTLARLSRFLAQPEFRERLLEIDTRDDLFRALQEEEAKE